MRRRPECPICKKEMKRKGKAPNFYFKCRECGGKLFYPYTPEQYRAKVTKESIEMHIASLKRARKEEQKRKLIKRLKKQKYLPFKTIYWDGEYINLDEYDKEGRKIEEVKQERGMEEEKEGSEKNV